MFAHEPLSWPFPFHRLYCLLFAYILGDVILPNASLMDPPLILTLSCSFSLFRCYIPISLRSYLFLLLLVFLLPLACSPSPPLVLFLRFFFPLFYTNPFGLIPLLFSRQGLSSLTRIFCHLTSLYVWDFLFFIAIAPFLSYLELCYLSIL